MNHAVDSGRRKDAFFSPENTQPFVGRDRYGFRRYFECKMVFFFLKIAQTRIHGYSTRPTAHCIMTYGVIVYAVVLNVSIEIVDVLDFDLISFRIPKT